MGLGNDIIIGEVWTPWTRRMGGPSDTATNANAVNIPGLQPITYTPGIDKTPAVLTTQAANAPIAQQQGIDKNAASAIQKGADPSKMKGVAGQVWNALLNGGMPVNVMPWVFALCYMESGGFSNTLTKVDNNPSSIMMFPGAEQGTFVKANGTYAAHFKTLDKWGAQMYREMTKGSNPIGAKTLQDFVHRLKINKYMGNESEASYLGKLQATMKRLNLLNTDYTAADKKMKKDAHPAKKGLPMLAWVGIGIGGLILINNITR